MGSPDNKQISTKNYEIFGLVIWVAFVHFFASTLLFFLEKAEVGVELTFTNALAGGYIFSIVALLYVIFFIRGREKKV